MKRDKIKVYALGILLMAILFFALIVLNRLSYIEYSIILGIITLIAYFSLPRKKQISINKKSVNLFMLIFALLYLGVFYLLGLVKYDFYQAPAIFSFKTLYRFIIPLALIVISSEIIRYKFLSQDAKIRILKKEIDLLKIILFISMILIDLIIYVGIYDLNNYDDFLTVLGFILFASISCNLFYNYVSSRYGMLGIIIYRMITILYAYIIPIIPNVYVYFRAFLRMIYPYIMYIILERAFSSTDFVVAYKDKRKNFLSMTILIITMVLLTMLISCQFKYGMLVIGSGSMTGAINYGDAVIYESYDNQVIQNGDIIIFERNGIRLVHRVIKIRNIDNEIRYYTKGDANKVIDSGYVSKNNIVGITKLRVMYLGYPTLWVRSLFS